MRRVRFRAPLLAACLGLSAFVFGAARVQAAQPERWSGIDESVIEKVAAAAGRAPRAVLFDLQGDLALFVFLCAGIAGGAVFGYYFRVLFVEHFDAAPNGARASRGNKRPIGGDLRGNAQQPPLDWGASEQSRTEPSALPAPPSAPSHAEARGD